MNAIDYILDGLEAELALERELGVRSVEIDRSLLASVASAPPAEDPAPCAAEPQPKPKPPTVRASGPAPAAPPRPVRIRPSAPVPRSPSSAPALDFIFLHHVPLSEAGNGMMAKIVAAMGRTAETAPVVAAPPAPPAKIRVVLGGLALKKWFPGRNAEPGQWFADETRAPVLVTYSPEYILRFRTVTPALQKIKKDMWNSLKGVLRRLDG